MKRWFRQTAWLGVGILMAIVPVACGAPTPALPTAVAIASPIPRQTPALPTPVPRSTPLPPPATFTPVLLPTATTAPTITQTPTATPGNAPAAFVMPGAATNTPAPTAPSDEPDAGETVARFAADTLGIAVMAVSAGEIDLPPQVQSAVAAGMAVADETVAATLETGLAAVGTGDDGSLVVVVLWRENPLPATAEGMLALVRETFPALADVPLQAVQSGGNLPASPGKVLLPPPEGGTPQPLPGGGTGARFFAAEPERSVLAGVFPAENNTFAIFAVVGNGSFAAMIQP